MAYDAERGRMVMFGGLISNGQGNTFVTDHLWEWDGTSWTQWTVEGDIPPGLHSSQWIYDAHRRRFVLHGGYRCTDADCWRDDDIENGTWELAFP